MTTLNEINDKWIIINQVFINLGEKMPESLARVQKLTGKTLTFYEADLCDKDSLRRCMSAVIKFI